MRKEAGFEVQDHIKFYYQGNDIIGDIITRNSSTVCDEVLAITVEDGDSDGYTKEWNINGEKVNFLCREGVV